MYRWLIICGWTCSTSLILPGFLTTAGNLQRSVTPCVESPINLPTSQSVKSPRSPSRILLASVELWKQTQSTENRWQVESVHSLIFHDIYIRICVETASAYHLNVFSYQQNSHLKNVISFPPIPVLSIFHYVSNGYVKVGSGCSIQ